MESIGDRLKNIRLELNMNQQQFADIVGVSRSTYTNYEAGREVPRYVIMALHWKFMLSIDFLLYGRGEKYEKNIPKIDNLNSEQDMDERTKFTIDLMIREIEKLRAECSALESENRVLRKKLGLEESLAM